MKNEDLFDVKNITPDFLRELFEKFETPWEVIKNLKECLENNIKSTSGIDTETYYFEYDYEDHRRGEFRDGIVIEPYVYISRDVTIRPHAYIRSYSIICDNCVVGHSSEIKESIMLPGSRAPHFNYVGNSILGHNVNLGAGVILANYKISNRKEILVRPTPYPRDAVNTKMEKLGAMIGDNASLGCGIITNPGTIIKQHKVILRGD